MSFSLRRFAVGMLLLAPVVAVAGPTTCDRHVSTHVWNNQPPSFRVIEDQPWDSFRHWAKPGAEAGLMSIVSDSVSQRHLLEYKYPAGFVGGVEPGHVNYTIPAEQRPTEIFIGLTLKISKPYQNHSSGVNKFLFVHDDNDVVFSALWFELYGFGSAPYRISLVNQFAGCPSIRIDPNVVSTAIRPGEWHTYEIYLKMASDLTANDGVVRVWVDGALNIDAESLCTRAAKVRYVDLDAIWGGVGEIKRETDYYWYDHTIIAVP